MNMKKWILLLLTLCLAAALSVSVSAAEISTDAVSGEWTYSLSYGEATITDYSGSSTSVTIPSSLDGYTVAEIGSSVFSDHYEITSITLPNTLKTIGSYAFQSCRGLTTITLPKSLTSIGYRAFHNCYNLERITIHSAKLSSCNSSGTFTYAGKDTENGIAVIFTDTVTEIPAFIFVGSGDNYPRITSVQIGSGVKTIGAQAFNHCTELRTVSLSADTPVTLIDSNAFSDCFALESIVLPKTLTTLGYHAFHNCYDLRKVTIHSARLSSCNSSGTFTYAGKNAANGTAVIFSDSVVEIPAFIFVGGSSNYPRITSVQIGKNVKTIGAQAFNGCSSLKTVDIGRYMKLDTIEDQAFGNCTSLTHMTIPSWVTNVGYRAFYNCTDMFRLDVVNPTCKLYNDRNTLGVSGKTVIYGYDGTTAEDYANKYGYTFQPIHIPFSDVHVPDFYLNPTMWAVENSITSGTSATTFSPNDPCQRAHVVTFLWRAAGAPAPKSSTNPFVDVPADAFYYKAVLWAVENGITAGADATHFNPFGICDRAQVVTFLHRAMGKPAPDATVTPFTDVPADAFYYTPVLWAVENGITNGLSATAFGPNTACNRAQVVTFLYRTYN